MTMISDDNSYLHVDTLNNKKKVSQYATSEPSKVLEAVINSPFDNIPGFTKPSKVAILDNSQLTGILCREGFEVNDTEIQALNFFNSPIGAFQYALYSFGVTDFYIVLMINRRQRSVYGYHVIDFTDKYSLSDDLSNRMKTSAMVL